MDPWSDPKAGIAILATDLDNTILPAPPSENTPAAIESWTYLLRDDHAPILVYATGRHLDSALAAVESAGLPEPDVLITDVGTRIHHHRAGNWEYDASFAGKLAAQWPVGSAARIRAMLSRIDGFSLQPDLRQSEHKASGFLGVDTVARQIREAVGEGLDRLGLSARVIISRGLEDVDLLDVLPLGGGKKAALDHLLATRGSDRAALLFAGDSGNDEDVLLSGCRAILVGNADPAFRDHLRSKGEAVIRDGALYFAEAHFLAGVLEGCIHFGLPIAD